MAVTVCGCGDKNANTNSNGSTSTANPADSNNEPSNDDNNSTDVNYKTFGDLPRSQRMGDLDIYINTADYRTEGYGYGFATSDSLNYAIITASASTANPGVSIDDAFATTFNDDYHSILMQFRRATYAEFTPQITDRVTLACGAEAIKFEGKQPANDYGTESEYYIYGYGFVFNDVPMIVSYVVTDESAVDDAKKAELAGYVDEMIQTVRTQP